MSDADRLLPDGVEVPFAEIAATLARGSDRAVRSTPPRALTATVVAVGPDDRLREASDALRRLARRAAIRTILISEGTSTKPTARVADDAVAVPGLSGPFVNNAVAALRLSSLPTMVWWRGGSPEILDDLATLVDRVVLDDPDPLSIWRRAVELFDRASFSDMRWTRLTRWRTLMAQFFDIPEVRAAASRFERLDIKGTDQIAASLFASWLIESLGRRAAIRLNIQQSTRRVFLEEVRLSQPHEELTIELGRSGACVLTSSDVQGHSGATRMVSLGEQGDVALIAEELRIRVRDGAFERAVLACLSGGGLDVSRA